MPHHRQRRPSRPETRRKNARRPPPERRRTPSPAQRRKARLVHIASVVAILVPALLVAGVNLSSFIYPAPPAPIPLIDSGSNVTLQLQGWLDSGDPFLPNHTVTTTVGSGDLVPGLEDRLVGLGAGADFNFTIAPDEAYGAWDVNRTVRIPRFDDTPRTYTIPEATFQQAAGTPTVGEQVPTQPWPSTVVSVSGGVVLLEYEATVGQTLHLYRYWLSAVDLVTSDNIRTENRLTVGTSFSIPQKSGAALVVRVADADDTSFLLDYNPPLAGQTLHFEGTVLSVRPGSSVSRAGGAAVSLGADSCERCHVGAGFQAVSASASAVRSGTDVLVNITVDNPWDHELQRITADATFTNDTVTPEDANGPLSNLASGGQETTSLALPVDPGRTLVTVVVNATAHHIHQSGGKPSDLPYQLTINIPVGGATHLVAPAPVDRSAGEPWALVGQVTGFATLAFASLPAVQGFRRHLRRPPKFKWPPWLTTHFSMSVGAVSLSAVHSIALMSTTYLGLWTWDVWAGVVGMLILATMGITGVLLAKWSPRRWKKVRKVHYWLMASLLAAGSIHIIAGSTTLRWLVGIS